MNLKKLATSLVTAFFYCAASAAQTTEPRLSLATIQGVDVMKMSKDVMTNQPSYLAMLDMAWVLPGRYIGLAIPMDGTADYPLTHKPKPLSAEQFTQNWANAVHAQGKNVLWRGTWAGIEGIYNFPKKVGANRFPAGTAASAPTDGNRTWLGKTYQYIVSNPFFFKDGDIWAPLPERTEGIFQDATSFLPYTSPGIQANYAKFFADLKTVSDMAFAKIGRKVITGMSANNYTEVISGWLPQSFFDKCQIIAIDYYGKTHTPQEMEADFRKMYALRKKPIFLQEWADYWNSDATLTQTQRTAYLQSMLDVIQRLSKEGIVVGFNYWGGWINGTEGILTQDSNGFHLNYRGTILWQFYFNNSFPLLAQSRITRPR